MATHERMDQQLWDNLKQGVLLILIGAVFSVVPFYFQTVAQTTQNSQDISGLKTGLEQTRLQLEQTDKTGLVNETEIKQIKASLERIEKKIDRLIDEDRR